MKSSSKPSSSNSVVNTIPNERKDLKRKFKPISHCPISDHREPSIKPKPQPCVPKDSKKKYKLIPISNLKQDRDKTQATSQLRDIQDVSNNASRFDTTNVKAPNCNITPEPIAIKEESIEPNDKNSIRHSKLFEILMNSPAEVDIPNNESESLVRFQNKRPNRLNSKLTLTGDSQPDVGVLEVKTSPKTHPPADISMPIASLMNFRKSNLCVDTQDSQSDTRPVKFEMKNDQHVNESVYRDTNQSVEEEHLQEDSDEIQITEDIDIKDVGLNVEINRRRLMSQDPILIRHRELEGLQFKACPFKKHPLGSKLKMSVDIGNRKYTGAGNTMKTAKRAAAQTALDSKYVFSKLCRLARKEHLKEQLKQVSALLQNTRTQCPLALVHALNPDAKYIYDFEGRPLRFSASVNIHEDIYIGFGDNRKQAKVEAARAILASHYELAINTPSESLASAQTDEISFQEVANRDKLLDKYKKASHVKFSDIVEVQAQKCNVLTNIFTTEDEDDDQVTVITITKTKCLKEEPKDGHTMFERQAENLSRGCFRDILYSQIVHGET